MAEVNASLSALRALSALLLRRMLKPVVFLIGIFLVAALALTVMLSLSFSQWWLLLLVLLIPISLLFLLLGIGLHVLLQKLLPRKLSVGERTQINDFTEKIFSIAERTRTPYPVIIFLIAKDLLRGKESKFVSQLLGDSRSLMTEFDDIQALFKK